MPTVLPEPPILNSSGSPANGYLRVRASRPYDLANAFVNGHITRALAVVRVVDGIPLQNDSPWFIPPTPDGVWFDLEQDLDGESIQRFSFVVPSVESLSYTYLLSNRGGVGVGWEPYWWDLTGGIDFPPGALNGDWGIDTISGDAWRYLT